MKKENLIEILNIEGNAVAVERIDEKNFKVNLTQLGQPYGRKKRPVYWLESKSTKEYLLYRQWKKEQNEQRRNSALALEQHQSRNSCFAQEQHQGKNSDLALEQNQRRNSDHGDNSWEDFRGRNSDHGKLDPTYGGQIIVKQGGNPYEQGTWCTDYHIALDYVAWLDPKRKDAIYDVFLAFMYGQLVAAENTPIAGVAPIQYMNSVYYPYNELLKAFGMSTISGSVWKRKRVYPREFLKIGNTNFVSRQLAKILYDQHKLNLAIENAKQQQFSIEFKED